MLATLIMIIIFGGCILLALLIFFLRTLIKDKRMEDAMQRQRERQNDEMWRRINKSVGPGRSKISNEVTPFPIKFAGKRSSVSSSEDGALVMIPGNRVVRIKDCREAEGEVFAFHHWSMLVHGTIPAIDRWQAAGCPMDALEHTHDEGVSFMDDGWRLGSA